MGISRSEIVRGKKGTKNEKSWEIMRGQWGLPKAMGISRSDIVRGKKDRKLTRAQSVLQMLIAIAIAEKKRG